MHQDSSERSIAVFDEHAEEYDRWFDEHPAVFQSELEALKKVLPEKGTGLEIGVGSGRFAERLGIQYGVEPARAMRVTKIEGLPPNLLSVKGEKIFNLFHKQMMFGGTRTFHKRLEPDLNGLFGTGFLFLEDRYQIGQVVCRVSR